MSLLHRFETPSRLVPQWIGALLIASASLSSPLNAEAGTVFSVFGAGDFSSFSYSVSRANLSSEKTRIGVGAGAQLEFGLVSKKGITLSLEVGAAYVRRALYLSDSTVPINYGLTLPGVQFPVMFKAWYGPWFYVGIGMYYAMGLGNLTVSDTSNAAVVSNGSHSYASRGLKKNELGLIGSLGFKLPLGLFVESRFLMGSTDVNSPAISGLTTKTVGAQVLVGARFFGKLQ